MVNSHQDNKDEKKKRGTIICHWQVKHTFLENNLLFKSAVHTRLGAI